MRWKTMRGLSGLALAFMATSAVFAQESLFLAQSGSFGSDITSPTSTSFDIAGISRLVEVNGTQDSLLRSHDDQPRAYSERTTEAPAPIAPIAEVSSSNGSTGMFVLAGFGAAFAMGLGLCCVSMMSRKQRTIHTFTAGFVRVNK